MGNQRRNFGVDIRAEHQCSVPSHNNSVHNRQNKMCSSNSLLNIHIMRIVLRNNSSQIIHMDSQWCIRILDRILFPAFKHDRRNAYFYSSTEQYEIINNQLHNSFSIFNTQYNIEMTNQSKFQLLIQIRFEIHFNQNILFITLRGGGAYCSQYNMINVSFRQSRNDEAIQNFIKDVGQRCDEIQQWSNKIGLQESKDQIIDIIKWFNHSSQFINQLNRNPLMVRENLKLIMDNLKSLFSSIQNIIQSQKFLALQLLNVCNQFSRLIFIYYVNNPQYKMKQQEQESIKQQLEEISQIAQQDQQNSYQNSIYYQLTLIQICIDTCPTDSQQGQEIIMSTFNGILSSITEMSLTTDLLEAIGNGALFLFNEYKKKQQQQIFQIISYIEELKWQIIEELQNGIGINKILAIMSQNYKQLVLQSKVWIIKCSWIKIISEILIYKPLITRSQYDKLVNQYQLTNSWEEVIELKLIHPVDSSKYIGIIKNQQINNRTSSILNIQFNKLDQFKKIVIGGHLDIPKLQDLVICQSSQELSDKKINQIIQFQQFLESLPLLQIQYQFKQFINQFQEYDDAIQEVRDDYDSNSNIIFDQIEQLILLNQQISTQQKELYLNVQILLLQLTGISNAFKFQMINDSAINECLLYSLFQQYYEFQENRQLNLAFQETQQQLIDKLKASNFILFNKADLLLEEIIKQSQLSDVKQKIICIKQQIQAKQLENKMESADKLSSHIKIVGELQQIFEKEIRLKLNKNKILLVQVQQTKNIKTLQKLESIELNQVFYFNYQMNAFYSINQIISELKPDECKIEEIKSQIALIDLIRIDHSLNAFELNEMVLQKDSILFALQSLTNQQDMKENLEFQSQMLKLLKQYFIKYGKMLQEIIQHMSSYICVLKDTQQPGLQQDPSIIYQLRQNLEQLKNLQAAKFNQQDLSQTIHQRIEIFQNFQQDEKNQDLRKLVQKEIQFYKFFIDEDYIQQVTEQIMTKIELNQAQIITCIQNQQNQLQESYQQTESIQQYIQYFEQIITLCKQLSFQLEKESQAVQSSSLFIFQISQLVYSDQENSKDQIEGITHQYYDSIKVAQAVINDNLKVAESIFSLNPDQFSPIYVQEQQIKQLFPSYEKLCRMDVAEQVQQQNSFDLVKKFKSLIEDDSWRIKEYFYFNLINIFSQIPNQSLKGIIGQLILYGKYKETDIRIIQTLKNKELVSQMQQLITSQWEETKDDIHSDLQKTLNQLQGLQLQLQGEERKFERDKILQQHRELEQQLEQQMQNVNEISDVLGITIHFLKDIRKDLGIIQNKLDNIIDTIEQIGQDIKFLRGKSPQQLLEIRMEHVLQNQIIQDAQSVYVQMWTKENKLEKQQEDGENDQNEIEEQTPLFNYDQINTGEVDEFLLQENKSSLLIHGPAGSGKSLTARKIEEYLWKQYQLKVNNQKWEKITDSFIIPIFIQLPALKEPKFSAVEETLKSTQYKFDQKQIDLFKDMVQYSEKIKLLFIMDSYDELSKEYQQINLITTNKLNQWKKQTVLTNPKVITTSRSEIFTNLDYRQWFYGDEKVGISGYKEIRILPFDDSQRNEFLDQFSYLQLKLQIKELIEIISKKKQSDVILQDTINIFQQIKPLIQSKQISSYLINGRQSQQVLNMIKSHPNVIAINSDQELSFMKQIQKIWSIEQYNKSIEQMEIRDILETPFMMNIVVEVLPQMNEKFSSQNYIKNQFQKAYIKNKQSQIKSIIKMYQYGNLHIQQSYSNEEIMKLQQINASIQEIKNESQSIWEYLVNYNFFKKFSAQLNYNEILQVFDRIQNQNQKPIPFTILNKEREVDNQVIVYKALTTRNSSLYDFYEVFLQNYIEKQRQKHIYNSQINDQDQFLIDIHQFAQRLAVTMTKQNDTIIEMKIQGVLFRQKVNNDPYQEFFQDQDKYANYRKLIIKCLPIKQKSNYFSFNHKSIQEYLFAKDIIDFLVQVNNDFKETIQLLRKQINDQDSNIYQPIKSKMKEFIQQSSLNYVQLGSMPAVIKFVKAGIQFNTELQDSCYHLSLLSSIFNEFVVLSSNALLILANVLLCISDQDFSKIIIQDINLDRINFINCDFRESRFNRVNIVGINLNYSNLTKASWVDCYSNDTHTLKLPKNVICGCVCFSKQDDLIISGCTDGIVRIWDKKQGLLSRELNTQSEGVYYVSQSDNSQIIITVSKQKNYDFQIQFWDFETLKLLSQQKTIFNYYCTLLSHSKEYIVFSSKKKTLQAYDFILQKSTNVLTLQYTIQNFQMKTGTYQCYILQVQERKILIWDIITNDIIRKIEFLQNKLEFEILCNQFTSDCQLYAYRYSSKFVIFNTENQQNIEIFYPQEKQIDFYFSEDKKYIAFSEFYGFAIMDAESQQFLTPPLFGHTSSITCVRFSNQSQDMITCANDSLIKFWDLNMLNNKQKLSLKKLTEARESFAQYSQDGQRLYIKSNNKLSGYDPFTGQLVESLNLSIEQFLFRPNGKQIIYINESKTYCYDINKKLQYVLPIESESLLKQSKDGQLYFYQILNNQTYHIVQFDEQNFQIKRQSQEIQAEFGHFSSDNNYLHYVYKGQIIEAKIDLEENDMIQKGEVALKGDFFIRSFKFTIDRKQIVLDSSDNIEVYDRAQQTLLHKIDMFKSANNQIQFDFLNNSQHLIVFDEYNIFVFDTVKYQQQGIKLQGHKTGVNKLIPSPSGLQFITIGEDEAAIKVWDLNQQQDNNQQNVYIERLIIPQQLNQSALVNNCNFEGSQILSHLGYNLNNIWNGK